VGRFRRGLNPVRGSRKQPDTAGPDQCSVAEEWLRGSLAASRSTVSAAQESLAILLAYAL
jgi:hypothetical protein